jgi:two-component system, LytTR family, sensor kinase
MVKRREKKVLDCAFSCDHFRRTYVLLSKGAKRLLEKASRTTYLIALLLWTAFGIFSALEMRVESSILVHKNSWADSFFQEVTFTTVCAILTPGILWLAHRFRIDAHPRLRNVAIHLGASALFTVTAKVIWMSIIYVVQQRPFSAQKFLANIVYAFDYGVVLYWVLEYYRGYQKGMVDAAKLHTELAQAQLRWLKAQLHPHFLFNALHTISALVQEDPEAAERMIARLSDLLRLSLRDSAVQEVPLKQELEHVNMYLDIERARFDERLVVRFALEDGTEQVLVPSFVLQPLVENAIRHGIGNRARGGEITISCKRDGQRIALSVADNGAGLRAGPLQPLREGIGLSTVRGRLEKLYGASQSLVIRNFAAGGVEVVLTLPFTRENMDRQEAVHETA